MVFYSFGNFVFISILAFVVEATYYVGEELNLSKSFVVFLGSMLLFCILGTFELYSNAKINFISFLQDNIQIKLLIQKDYLSDSQKIDRIHGIIFKG